MHPDRTGYITGLHAYFRQILVDKLSPEQLQLHDYYSATDPLYDAEADDYPVTDGLPEPEYDEDPGHFYE